MPATERPDPLASLFASAGATRLSEQGAALRARAALFGVPVAPRSLSRYRLDRPLGSGAMGEVWLARDPELSRMVAIKLVKDPGGAHVERLAREARALAKLSHPNVVQIFDVGTYPSGDGSTGVFVVMELVDGDTVQQWLAARQRSWREIVAVFCDVAAGLAAAHDAGIVHRDVKPANVFIGRDGRVRVGDFGLARSEPSSVASDARRRVESEVRHELAETLAGTLTAAGTAVGTPLYMAPEQHLATRVDARSDQYAMCVALYEALARKRPFSGSIASVLEAKLEERFEAPEIAPALPAALRRAVMRGLRADPSQRWPSMAALRAALLESLRPQRRMPVFAGLALLVALGGIAWLGTDDCERREIEWTNERRAAVRESVVDALGAESSVQVLGVLDTRVEQLRIAGADACVAPGTIDRACLRDAGTQLETTIEILERADPFASRSAVEMALAVPDPDHCAASADAPVNEGRFVTERDAIARARALDLAGLAKDVLAVVEPAIASATQRGASARGLVAELELLAAAANDDLGMPVESLDGFRRSYYAAVEGGDGRLAMRAAMRVAITMAEQGDHDAAAMWLGHAAAGRARAKLSVHDEAIRDSQLAMIAALRGDLDESAATMQRAIDACANGTCPRTYVSSLMNLAQVHLREGAHERAVELARRAVEESDATGAEIDRAHARIQLASALSQQQHHREALDQIEAATAILDRLDAGGSPLAARAAFVASQALGALGRGPEAVAAAERAWALIQTQTLPGDPRRESFRASLAATRGEAGDYRGAVRELDGLLAEDSSDLVNRAGVLATRGHAREQLGDLDGAIADARAARALTLAVAPDRVDWIARTYGNELSALYVRGGCEPATALTHDMLAWADAHAWTSDRVLLRSEAAAIAITCGDLARATQAIDEATAIGTPGSREMLWVELQRLRVASEVDLDAAAALRQRAEDIDDAGLVARIDELVDTVAGTAR